MTEVRAIDARHFIAGEHWAGAEAERFDVTAPEDGRLLGRAPIGRAEDIDRAVAAARGARGDWAGARPEARERVLLAAAQLLETEGEARFLDLVIDESGSTVRKARREIAYSASLLRTAAGEARRLYGDTFPNDDPARLSLVVREPLGVVAVLSPFNAPLALLAKMASFPLAAGNTAVVKPSERTPLTALAFNELLHDAGLPPGVLNTVMGFGQPAGAALVAHPDVDGIAFTGSSETGAAIARVAAARHCRAQLELGGNNPLLVLDDARATLDDAAALACQGAFANAGQICMASSRIIVERGIYDDFVAAMARAADSLELGALRDERTAYGPVIDDAALERVEAHVADALTRGATLAAGGRVVRARTYAATVLANVSTDARAWREETFGPVACVVAADDLDHAIALANDSDYGLSAAVLTRDVHRGLRAAREIRAGSVHVGMHSFQSNALAPIGGVGKSGIGKSGGKYSTEQFTELKWVSVQVTP